MPRLPLRLRPLVAVVSVAGSLLAAAPLVAAQAVTLEIRPHVGDTLRMRLDQEVELTGWRREGSADSAVTRRTRVGVLSRTVVERSEVAGTTVLTLTDSVNIGADGPPPPWVAGARALQGQRLRLHVAPDGTTSVLDDQDAQRPELRAVFAQMPATLPDRPLAVGGTWSREMAIPVGGRAGAKRVAALRTLFRLDSLSRSGELAFISMRGTLSHDTTAAEGAGIRHSMSGLVSGSMVIDRRRAWVADARTTMTVTSLMIPPAGVAAAPMRFRMKLTQWLRSVP